MDWLGFTGTACIVAAVLGIVALVNVFRAGYRAARRSGLAFAAMVTLGALSPILLLGEIVLLGTANSGSFGR